MKTRRGSKNDETCCVLNERTRNFARQRQTDRVYGGCMILETRTEISPVVYRRMQKQEEATKRRLGTIVEELRARIEAS